VNSGAFSLSYMKIQFRELVYGIEDYASGRYDVATGRFAFASDVSGTILSTAISHHISICSKFLCHHILMAWFTRYPSSLIVIYYIESRSLFSSDIDLCQQQLAVAVTATNINERL